MIDHETIERIMNTARIEEVIGDFVSLKKRGANHIGCCPFHNEKTPSFYVSPAKGIFKCFGCGKAGDVVTFLKEHEHYTYPEALEYLARKYNIEIQEEEQTEEQKERQSERDALFHASEFAQKYFADLLYNDEMGRAIGLSYFHSRGLSDETIKAFGLGFCLDEWSAFTDHAIKNGYSKSVLEKTGLTIVKEETGKMYDRFRGRVMFPIFSISGRVLGFSGRVLTSEKQAAKYVNSPDSEIYNKSRILYGLYQARSAIAKAGKCYLVEGNVDVISMHQSGVQNTVASCGTSLTTEQIRLIKRYTPNVTVLYDGDSAGIKAALRAVNLLFQEGMHVRVVLFPDGEDPDSYAQKYGSTKLQEYLSSHEDNFVIFKTRVLMDGVMNDPIRKAELVKETIDTIALVPDLIERSEYVRQCASLLSVPEETLNAELAKAINRDRIKAYEAQNKERREAAAQNGNPDTATDTGTQPDTPQPVPVPQPVSVPDPRLMPIDPAEKHLISLLLNYGSSEIYQPVETEDGKEELQKYPIATLVVSDIENSELSFNDPRCQSIYNIYRQAVAEGRTVDTARIVNSGDDSIRQLAISLMFDTYRVSKTWKNKGVFVPQIEDNLQHDMNESLNNFKLKCVKERIHQISEELRRCTEYDDIRILLATKQQLLQMEQQIGKQLNRVIS